ncbi:sulfite exporter TauE/SafE family protein [Pelagerythrobacter aerophilus]
MEPVNFALIALLMALAAALYSSVGHGGASAYLAIMALFALPIAAMRPTALALNLLVAGFGTVRYVRAGQFNLRLFLAFAVAATPFAYLGGTIEVPPEVYRPLVGVVLFCAALRLLWKPRVMAERPVRPPPLWISIPAGAALGLLAGLTGTGGGIFLSPLILLLGWEKPRATSGVAAAFILANSTAGLAGNVASLGNVPTQMPLLLAAVGAGALVGVWLGVRRLPQSALLQLLGLVLAVAGAKLLFT